MAVVRSMMTRRALLVRSGLGLASVGAIALAQACAAPTPPPQPTAAPAAKPTEVPAKPAGTAAPAVAAPPPPAAPAPASSAQWQSMLEAGRKEGRVIMYGTLLGAEDTTQVGQEFKKATGIDFDFITLQGGPATTRIREELKVNRGPDIFEASGGWVGAMSPDGVFVPLKDKPLPVWSEPQSAWLAHPGYKAPDDYQFVLSRLRPRHGHISVNTGQIAEADYPKSWHELATDPKYKGKIVYLNPTLTTGASVIFMANVYVAKNMTAADFWGLFAGQDPLLLGQTRAEYAALAKGERAICLNAADETVLNLLEAGAGVKNLYFPNAPFPAQTAEMGVFKASQRQNAAMVFINWYLSKEGQDAVSRIQRQAPIRSDVKNYAPEELKGQVVGGGTRGKILVEKQPQTKLGSDVQASGTFKLLADRRPQDEFLSAWEAFIKDWEAKNGGPQDQPAFMQG